MQHTNRHSKRSNEPRLTIEERKSLNHKHELIAELKKEYQLEKFNQESRPNGDRVTQWANDLADALHETDIAKIEDLSKLLKTDRSACMDELTETAHTQCPPRDNLRRKSNKAQFVTGDGVLAR